MDTQIITIHVETDIDPSQLLDLAFGFGKHVTDMTSEPCVVDETLTEVAAGDDTGARN